jgi:hypothetical protein
MLDQGGSDFVAFAGDGDEAVEDGGAVEAADAELSADVSDEVVHGVGLVWGYAPGVGERFLS